MQEINRGIDMRIFVFEYTSGGGLLGKKLSELAIRTSDCLLRALISDLQEVDGVEVVTTRDARLPPLGLDVECWTLGHADDLLRTWHQCIASSDAVWPIAPEHDHILENISRDILQKGGGLLGNPPHALEISANPRKFNQLLNDKGLHALPTYQMEEPLPFADGSWVLKPIGGVGYDNGRIFADGELLRRQWETFETGLVAQRLIKGTAVGLSVFMNDRQALLLGICRQRMAIIDGTLVLLGCFVNDLIDKDDDYAQLSLGIAAALPSLRGLIGIDLIISESDTPYVLGIRSCLSVDYLGLKESTGINPAGLMLDLAQGKRFPIGLDMHRHTVDVDFAYLANC